MANTILVTTGTGTVGQALVGILAGADERVRAGSRAPERIAAGAGVEPIRFDFRDPATYGPALDGVDRVFVLVPTGESAPLDLLLPFLEAATAGKARKVVLMTADGVQYDDEIPYRKLELFVERSGAPFVILRPNWFMDNFHTYWYAPITQAGVIPVPAADARTAFIDARDIAAAAAAALLSDRFDGRAFSLTGPEALTYAEAAATLSAAAGREIGYAPVEDADFLQSMIAAGLSPDYAAMLTGLFGHVRAGAASQTTGAVEELTGRPPFSLAQYARDNAARWR
ncbi:MAG TPA: NAD(P)H-binding protein [Herpetosiphonaceae bacterium]|nr:NAD(P)H-binding protein [Herpetosiphonaceae bacterium]